MKVLILNGESDDGQGLNKYVKVIKEKLKEHGFRIKEILLREKNIMSCQGCFDCWVKTPGKCIIDDFGKKIAELYIKSDLVIYLSPVVFGGYSFQLKKALDRIIPLVTPFFKQKNKETHHKSRYDSYPFLLGIGVLENNNEDESEIFNNLLKRNAINFYASSYESFVISREKTLKQISKKLEVVLEEVEN